MHSKYISIFCGNPMLFNGIAPIFDCFRLNLKKKCKLCFFFRGNNWGGIITQINIKYLLQSFVEICLVGLVDQLLGLVSLVVGLVVDLVVGLVACLVVGLVVGHVVGLVVGLCLVVGLVVGLVNLVGLTDQQLNSLVEKVVEI